MPDFGGTQITMRLPSRLKRNARTGIYYFRLVLPQPDGTRKEKRYSLHTREPQAARLMAYRINAVVLGNAVARRQGPSVEEVLRNLQQYGAHELVIERDRRGAVTRLVAESEAELRMLPEMIGRMAEGGAFNAANIGVPGRPSLGFKVSEGIVDYLKSLPVNTPKKTKLKKKAAVEEWQKWRTEKLAKPDSLATVDKQEADGFRMKLIDDGLADGTLHDKIMWCQTFIEDMARRGRFQGENPFRGLVSYGRKAKNRAASKNGYKPFSEEELARLFRPDDYDPKNPHVYWSQLIALYTGARVSEICQVQVKDFFERDGEFCMSINRDGDRKSVKTDASVRVIPLHRRLILLGLQEYIEDVKALGESYLFFYLTSGTNGMGNAMTHWFSRRLDSLNMKGGVGDRKGFHSFRSTVVQRLEDAGVPGDFRQQFVGHEVEGEQRRAYGKGYPIRVLNDKIIPHLDWAFLHPKPYQVHRAKTQQFLLRKQRAGLSNARNKAAKELRLKP
jgi:integrase